MSEPTMRVHLQAEPPNRGTWRVDVDATPAVIKRGDTIYSGAFLVDDDNGTGAWLDLPSGDDVTPWPIPLRVSFTPAGSAGHASWRFHVPHDGLTSFVGHT